MWTINDRVEGLLGSLKQQHRKRGSSQRLDTIENAVQFSLNHTGQALANQEIMHDVLRWAVKEGRRCQEVYTKRNMDTQFAAINGKRADAAMALRKEREQREREKLARYRGLAPCMNRADVRALLAAPSPFSQQRQQGERVKEQWAHQRLIQHATVKTFPAASKMKVIVLVDLLNQVVDHDFTLSHFAYVAPELTTLPDIAQVPLRDAAPEAGAPIAVAGARVSVKSWCIRIYHKSSTTNVQY